MALSETFLITLTTTASATFLVCLRWIYRSKCSYIECCGLIKIDRDVRREEQLDMITPPSPNNSNKMERTISI
jgi:hypothetical protein